MSTIYLSGGTDEDWRLYRLALEQHYERRVAPDTGAGTTFQAALEDMYAAHAKHIAEALQSFTTTGSETQKGAPDGR